MLRGKEGVLAGCGHRALDGRKVLVEHVLRLASMPELGSILTSRATPAGAPSTSSGIWSGQGGPEEGCPHVLPEWKLLTPAPDTPSHKEAQDREEIISLQTEGRKNMTLAYDVL